MTIESITTPPLSKYLYQMYSGPLPERFNFSVEPVRDSQPAPFLGEIEKETREIKPELSIINFGKSFDRMRDRPYMEINPYEDSLRNPHSGKFEVFILDAIGSRMMGQVHYDDNHTKYEMLRYAEKLMKEQKTFEGKPFRVISKILDQYERALHCYRYILIGLGVLVNPLDTKIDQFVAPEEWSNKPYDTILLDTDKGAIGFLKRVILLGNVYVNIWQRKTITSLGCRTYGD